MSSIARWLASTSDSRNPWAGKTTLRSPESLEVERELTRGGRGVRFSPVDPNLLGVSFQRDGTLALFNATTGEELKRVAVIPGLPASIDREEDVFKPTWGEDWRDAFAVHPVAFSTGGERLLVLARLERNLTKCVIYRVTDLSEITSWTIDCVPMLAFASDGREVLASAWQWGTRILIPIAREQLLIRNVEGDLGFDEFFMLRVGTTLTDRNLVLGLTARPSLLARG